MPIYEYLCQACGHEFESLQKISDAPLVDCPICSKATLKKKVSAAGFRLSGGGWYETDFKSSKQKNLAGERDAVGDKSAGKDSVKEGAKEGAKPKDGGKDSKSETNKTSASKNETKAAS